MDKNIPIDKHQISSLILYLSYHIVQIVDLNNKKYEYKK